MPEDEEEDFANADASESYPRRDAREHSYLPSVVRMYVEETPRNKPRNPFVSIPIMSMKIVILPGEKLPFRIQDSEWIRYIFTELRRAETTKQMVQFGVFCADPVHMPRRRNMIRRRLLRQGMGPRQLNPISDRLLAELGQLEDRAARNSNDLSNRSRLRYVRSSSDLDNRSDDSDSDILAPGSRFYWERDRVSSNDVNLGDDADTEQAASIDTTTGVAATEHTETSEGDTEGPVIGSSDSSSEGATDDSDSRSLNYAALRYIPFVEDQADHAGHHGPLPASRPEILSENGAILMSNYVIQNQEEPRVRFYPPIAQLSSQVDPTSARPVDRIGTLVTVMLTHGDDSDDTMTALQQGQFPQELVVTAVAKSRFRIKSSQDDIACSRVSVSGRAMIRKFLVEIMEEESYARSPCPFAAQGPNRKRLAARYAALVTPIPEHIYWRYSPWRLIDSIRETTERIPAYEELFKTLKSGSDKIEQRMANPVDFSFWLASNLPFSDKQKLDILELSSSIHRLEYIHERMLETEKENKLLRCNCNNPIAQANHIFTVDGADGTTGNYVNRYGAVHQTTTVRELNEDMVKCFDDFSTRDSWFPGYGYRIMECKVCQTHLGWKFELVDDTEATSDLPRVFFGLTATGITI